MATNIDPSENSSQQDTPKLLHLSGLPVGQELIPECEVIVEGEGDRLDERYNDCEKNPGHPTFIPVKQFGFEHLPEELRTEQMMRSIKRRCNLTVRVVVRFTSLTRPDTFSDNKSPYPYSRFKGSKKHRRYGTGFILSPPVRKSGRCPCPLCQKSTQPESEYWEHGVVTATHVIYDDSEAVCSMFDCFYDSDEDEDSKTLYGIGTVQDIFVPKSDYKSDICHALCVTHDTETVRRILNEFSCTIDAVFNTLDYYCPPPKEVIVSHPHGCSKRITVGDSLYVTVQSEDSSEKENLIPFIAKTICRLPMKPWVSDQNAPQSAQIAGQYLRYTDLMKRLAEALEEGGEKSHYNLISCVSYYLGTKSTGTTHKEINIFKVLTGMACGLHGYANTCGLVPSTLYSVIKLDRIISFLFIFRLRNMDTVDLLDIGLLLWKCYFLLANNLFKNMFVNAENTHDVDSNVIFLFLENIYEWRPELLGLFDVHSYVNEKCQEYLIQHDMYPSLSIATKTVMEILKGSGITTNENEARSSDTTKNDDDAKGSAFQQALAPFCFLVHQAFQSVQEDRHIYDKNKICDYRDSNNFLQPGKEFQIPSNMMLKWPLSSEFTCRYYRGNPGYFMFPPGTEFIFRNVDLRRVLNSTPPGGEKESLSSDFTEPTETVTVGEFPFPDEAEIMSKTIPGSYQYSMNYRTDTCPGSSGAFLYHDLPSYLTRYHFVHSGSCGQNNNRSVLVNGHRNILSHDSFRSHVSESIMRAINRT